MQRQSFERPKLSERPVYRSQAPAAQPDRTELLQDLNRLQTRQRARKWRQVLVLLTLLLVLTGVAWRGLLYYQHQQLVNQIPAALRTSIPFPVYIPAAVHLKVQKDSVSYSAGSLIFTIGAGQNKLIVTEQAKPATFDINKFAGITDPTPVTSRLGSGVRGKVANRSIVILSTDKTLVTYVALSDASPDEMALAVTTLVKID